jgi:hypothetical protein
MKHTFLLPIVVILVAWLISADSAAAQPRSLVEIRNLSAPKRTICMYKGNATSSTLPTKCFVVNGGQRVVWNRNGNRSSYVVKLFGSGKLLHQQRAFLGENQIGIRSGRVFLRYVPPKRSQP